MFFLYGFLIKHTMKLKCYSIRGADHISNFLSDSWEY